MAAVNQLFPETNIVGTCLNRARQYRDKVNLISRFDSAGRKTPDLHTVTWGELEKTCLNLSLGLGELGLKPFDRVAVFGPNTPRWILAVFSILAPRGTFVPIYPSTKLEDVEWILSDSGARAVYVHGQEQLDKVLKVREKLPELKEIITLTPDLSAPEGSFKTFDQVEALGRAQNVTEAEIDLRIRAIDPQDLAAIIYTSGTTGRPKGVMLTHHNFVSQRTIAEDFDFNSNDVWFGHLPMCHVFGLTSDLLNSGFQGGSLFVTDSLETEELRMNLRTCRPTAMSSVPRLWEKIYLQIGAMVRTRPPAIQKYFAWAIEVGQQCFLRETERRPLPPGLRARRALAKPVFWIVKKRAGLDRLRNCHSGGGPINPDLIRFFGAIGINIYQGFGLTETAPITHACTPKGNKVGTVGRPIPGTECKLDTDGEILVKGPQVMKGYYNNPAATREAFTADGFFRTGDIGEIDSEGYLKITDRKKELIITRAGKNVAPQPIENAFKTDPFIEQVYAIGDNRIYIAALVVPNFEKLEPWARGEGISFKDRAELVRNEKVKKLMQERIDLVNADLSKYETIKKFAILDHEFTEAGGELTPTLKLKRRIIDKKYADLIESLYPKSES